MMNSYFKKKFLQEEYQQEMENQNLRPVTVYDQTSQVHRTLYYTPLDISQKIFNPQEWNINRFQIGRHIGKGKYGHVYLARQRKSKHIVALKILSKKQLVNSEVLNQVRREIQIHSHVKHPNIIEMYGFFFDQRKIYIIMEYAPGGQLYAVFRQKGRFPQHLSAKFIYQTIKAMKYLHGMNIIHRDLKPQNLMLCQDDVVKLSDFGWAVHTSKTRKTYCGTIDYLCPQIVNQQQYDTSLDLWTIGVLAYQLSAGHAPFQSSARSQTFKNIKNINFRTPQHFSPELQDFVKNMIVQKKKRMNQSEALAHPWIVKHINGQS